MNKKIFKFSSITVGSLINTFCSESIIELNNNSYIIVDGFKTSLKGFKLKKNEGKIKNGTQLLKYFLNQFSNFQFKNDDDDDDKDNGKKLEEVFKLQKAFNNYKLWL